VTVGPAGGGGPLEMAAGATGIWVNVPNENELVHIDPSTNAVVCSVAESGQPILDGTSVWVENGNGVDRVDPATCGIVASVDLATTLSGFKQPTAWGTAGFGSVWLPTNLGLARIDETTGRLIGLLRKVPNGDLAITADSIWSAGYGNAKLLRILPEG